MGTSTDAILAYGYDLGAEENLQAREAQESEGNPYGYLKTAWYDAENEEMDEGIVERMTRVLYEAIPGAPAVEYAWECEDPVKEHYGVWFQSHCSGEYAMWILTTSVTRAYRGSPKPVDTFVLEREPVEEGWDGKLETALRVLGITPLQEKPAWLLASYWSA